jgi:hypothetical protein
MIDGKIERKLEEKTILFEMKFLQQNQFQLNNLFSELLFSHISPVLVVMDYSSKLKIG